MSDSNLGKVNYPSGYNVPGKPFRTQTDESSSLTGSTPSETVAPSSDISALHESSSLTGSTPSETVAPSSGISAFLNQDALVTHTTKTESPGLLSDNAFSKLGTNTTLPEPGAPSDISELNGIDFSHPNMEAIQALLSAIMTKLNISAGKNTIQALKNLDVDYAQQIQTLTRKILEKNKKINNASGFEKFLHKVMNNDTMNKLLGDIRKVGPILSMVVSAIILVVVVVCIVLTVVLLVTCVLLIVYLAVFIACLPAAVFLFIDSVDQLTGNKIFDLGVTIIKKMLEAMGVDSEKAENVAKILTTCLYMLASGPTLIYGACNAMGRLGAGSEALNQSDADKVGTEKRAVEKLQQELTELIKKKNIVDAQIREEIARMLGHKLKSSATDSSVTSDNPNDMNQAQQIASSLGAEGEEIVESPELNAILIDIMQKIGMKFKQNADGSISVNTDDMSQSGFGKGANVTTDITQNFSESKITKLTSAFLADILNKPNVFDLAIQYLQKDLAELVKADQATHENEDLSYGERNMI